jgi:hypothetical protein
MSMRVGEIQREYLILKESLLYLANSELNQLQLIDDWLGRVLTQHDPEGVKTYLCELVTHVARIVPSIDPVGSPPVFFADIRDRISDLTLRLPDLLGAEGRKSCLEALDAKELAAWCFLGQPWGGRGDFAVPEKDGLLTERELLKQHIQRTRPENGSEISMLLRIAGEWDGKIRSSVDAVRVALVEQDMTGGDIRGFRPNGRIALLRSSAQRISGADDILNLINVHSGQGGKDLEREVRSAMEAARRAARECIGVDARGAFSITINVSDQQLATTGQSLGLGTAAGLFAVFSHLLSDRTFFIPGGSSVYTGGIGPDGIVRKLDDEQVRIKVKTAFHSPVKYLVLPKANEQVAEEEIGALQRDYPCRRLEIVPVRHLRDVFDHRQLTLRSEFTLRQRASRKLEKFRTTLAVTSSLLLVLLVAGYFLFVADWDDNPAQIRLRNNYYIIENRNGKELWRELFSPANSPYDIPPDDVMARVAEQTIIRDINNDGKNEVILSHPGNQDGFTNHVFCYSFDKILLWHSRVGLGIETYEGRYLDDKAFSITRIAWMPGTKAIPPRLVTLSDNNSYTNLVNTFDPNGIKLTEYLHIGTISAALVTLDRSTGEPRIVLGGMLNGFRRSVLLMLDPKHADGVSPHLREYNLLRPVIPPAEEVFYLMFPKPDIQQHLDEAYNHIVHMRMFKEYLLMVITHHGVLTDKAGIAHNSTSLIWDININSFKALAVNTSTEFDFNHDRLLIEGKITSRRNAMYKQALIDSILYWDGEKFVSTPTMNRRYLEALKKHD